MATVYRNPGVSHPAINPSPDGVGYTEYKEPDTRVPPKPRAVLGEIAVDGVAIPESAILHEAQHHPAENPGAALMAAAKALVVRQLLLSEAGRLGTGMRDQADAETSSEPARTADDATISALLEQELSVPSAKEAECRRYFDNNRDRFNTPGLFEARHILIAAAPGDAGKREKAKALAAALCDRLAASPGDFAALAKMHSDCPSSAQGGNLGQLAPGSTVAEFEAALGDMRPGSISREPVASEFGFHVIALDRAVMPAALPFEAVRQQIADRLEAQAWSRAAAQYVSILAGKAEISGIDLEGADSPLVQ